MFKLDPSPTYFAAVILAMLNADGELEKHQFEARFNRLGQEDIDALQQQLNAGDLTEAQLFDRVLVGWRGIKDADDNDLPFSPENRERLLNVVGMSVAIVNAFTASLNPVARAEMLAKN